MIKQYRCLLTKFQRNLNFINGTLSSDVRITNLTHTTQRNLQFEFGSEHTCNKQFTRAWIYMYTDFSIAESIGGNKWVAEWVITVRQCLANSGMQSVIAADPPSGFPLVILPSTLPVTNVVSCTARERI